MPRKNRRRRHKKGRKEKEEGGALSVRPTNDENEGRKCGQCALSGIEFISSQTSATSLPLHSTPHQINAPRPCTKGDLAPLAPRWLNWLDDSKSKGSLAPVAAQQAETDRPPSSRSSSCPYVAPSVRTPEFLWGRKGEKG